MTDNENFDRVMEGLTEAAEIAEVSTGATRSAERLAKLKAWQAEYYKLVPWAPKNAENLSRQVKRRTNRAVKDSIASMDARNTIKNRRQKKANAS